MDKAVDSQAKGPEFKSPPIPFFAPSIVLIYFDVLMGFIEMYTHSNVTKGYLLWGFYVVVFKPNSVYILLTFPLTLTWLSVHWTKIINRECKVLNVKQRPSESTK